jgi:hypothetical protein
MERLQDLLVANGLDLAKAKLLRHNLSKEEIKRNHFLGYIDIYQSIQTLKQFRDIEYIVSFLGLEGTEGTYLGCYKIDGYVPFERERLPLDFFWGDETFKDCVFWRLRKTDIMSNWIDRLVIDWGKGTINWCQNGTTEKDILCIHREVSEFAFESYDKVLLYFDTLRTIINNPKQHNEWKKHLSIAAGIYLITDTKTGKHYIGSASGFDGGIWGRWSDYARTKHGGNKRLIELIAADPDYCNNFQFSILEVFPIKRDKHEILDYESLYKRKLRTINFGLNDN